MAALGSWLGIVNGLCALLAIIFAGGLISIVYALVRGRMRQVLRNIGGMLLALACLVLGKGRIVTVEQARSSAPDKYTKMPYGLAVLVGAVAAAIGVQIWRSRNGI